MDKDSGSERGTEGARQSPSHRAVSVFDFDGTLRAGDTLSDFLRYYWRANPDPGRDERIRRRNAVLAGIGYIVGARDPAQAKAVAIRSLPSAASATVTEFWRQDSRTWFGQVLALLERELLSGRRVVIASASPEFLLQPLLAGTASPPGSAGWHLGGTGLELVATETVAGADGYLQMHGANCRNEQKLRKVAMYLGIPTPLSVPERDLVGLMVSDSAADLPLILRAGRALRVTRRGQLRPWPRSR